MYLYKILQYIGIKQKKKSGAIEQKKWNEGNRALYIYVYLYKILKYIGIKQKKKSEGIEQKKL